MKRNGQDPGFRGSTIAICGVICAWSLIDAWRLRWLSDDAFISFRYAQNLVEGQGLVFNAGERVEGYTNFLWTLLCALGMACGLEPEGLSMALGLLSFAGTLGLLAWVSLRVSRGLGTGTLFLAPIAYALHHHGRVFATSGLESALFVGLVLGCLVAAVEARSDKGWLVVGLLGSLAVLTRPDGALFYGLAAASSLLGNKRRGRSLLMSCLPGVALLLPWLSWKLAYYGSVLPNTFYAKAGHGSQWGQGGTYLWLYFRTYWPLLVGVLALSALLVARRRGEDPWFRRPVWVLVSGAVALHLLYLARVGGDFMFARFCLPVTPLLLIAVEVAALSLLPRRVLVGACAFVAVGMALVRPPGELLSLDAEDSGVSGIVEERSWYPPEAVLEARRQGVVLERMTQGTDARMVILGTQAMLAYYGRVPYVLEGHVGLTDYALARASPPEGSRVGHGQKADLGLLRERGIDLRLDFRVVQPVTPLTRIDLGHGVTGRILSYRSGLMAVLAERGAQFVVFEDMLDSYIAAMDEMPDEKVQREYTGFSGYYFQHNEDPVRQAVFEARLDRIQERDSGTR